VLRIQRRLFMSSSDTSNAGNTPLFQGIDEKERIYAPEQVPNNLMPDHEMDADSGQSGAATTESGRDQIAGADGNSATVPIIPVRPEVGITQPVALPAVTDDTINNTQ
jgi:hypothetical protein